MILLCFIGSMCFSLALANEPVESYYLLGVMCYAAAALIDEFRNIKIRDLQERLETHMKQHNGKECEK